MKEIYDKLNDYLNDICNYLERENFFFLENIDNICRLNDAFLQFIRNFPLNNKTIQNHLTYEDVYSLAREIIEHIDKNYLEDFDCLIQSGELDFSYENDYEDSVCAHLYKDGKVVKQLININREFNYSDVVTLVHEFIHYTNGKKKSKNKIFFGEFLSIYFEFYAMDYLLEKDISKEEIDYLGRIKSLKQHSIVFFQYEIILLAYTKFGNLNDHTVSLLQQYFFKIKKEVFEKECTTLYHNLCVIEEENRDRIREHPNERGYILANKFMNYNYKYILGTLLAIYARKYSQFHDIVHLNNHIHELDDKTILEVCLSIGIDLNDEDFNQKLFGAVDEYLKVLQTDHKKGI